MIRSAALVGLALTACAKPSMVETTNIAVNSEHPYSFYTRKLPDARTLKPGELGNCTDIAFTEKRELAKQGIHSTMFACNLRSGIGHAFLLPDDGRVLDSRFDEVVPYSEVRCR